MVIIRGLRMEVKRSKTKNIKNISKSKNNIKGTRVTNNNKK